MTHHFKESEAFIFHHIGSLTSDLNQAEKAFTRLGFAFDERIYDPIQDVNLSFGRNSSDILLELVEPKENSKVHNLLNRNGSGPYHICFEVNSIDEEEKKLGKSGFICANSPKKAIAFQDRLVAFYYNPVHGLIELLEKSPR